jgi:phage baseplate assembly protein W
MSNVTTIGTLNVATQAASSATAASSARNFGVELWCTSGIRSGLLVSGLTVVAQAIFRRLTTPKGSLYGGEDEANYGLDLVGILGSAATPNQAAAVPGQVEAEVLKDERVDSCTVTVTSITNGPVVAWTVTIAAVTGDGPFTLVLGVSDVTVQLLGVTV